MRSPRACVVLVVAVVLAALPAVAGEEADLPPRVRDSWVRLRPPPGFEPSALGFEKKEEVLEGMELAVAGVWVMPLEFGIGDAESKLEEFIEERGKGKQLKEVGRREVTYEGATGIEVQLDQDTSPMTLLIVGDEQRSAMVTAYCLGDRRKTYDPAFRKMLARLIWDPPEDTLPFAVGKSRKLPQRRAWNGTLIVRQGPSTKAKGRFAVPAMTVTPFLERPVPTAEREKLIDKLLGDFQGVTDVTRGEGKPVKIGDLVGVRTLVAGVGDGKRVALIHWVLFDERGYFTLVGMCPTAVKGRWVPEFTKLAKTFRPRAPADGK